MTETLVAAVLTLAAIYICLEPPYPRPVAAQ